MSDNTAPLLDLAVNRTILLIDRGRTFSLECRRILKEDWLAYFGAIKLTSEQSGKSRVNTMDFETPRKLLAERVLMNAMGYKVSGGGALTDVQDWQQRLPLAHRLELGRTLADVAPSKAEDDFMIFPTGEDVLLDATWSKYTFTDEEENTRAAMQRFKGLKHIFKTPTEAQHKRYSQQASRSTVIGGSRAGTTVYAGAQALLCDLYDELILSVEGYCIDGVVLTDKSGVIREMDACHKFAAAQELFNPTSTVSTEEAGK